MTSYKCLLYEMKDGIATLTLNRPDRLNALGDTLREDLQDAVTRASEDAQVRVIVVTGAGKGFCAGGDVKAMNERKEQGAERPLIEKVAPGRDRTVLALRDAPKPVIAAVNGAAAGAGMNLALACDIRLASTAAKFAQAFVKRGLHPDWGGTYFLPRVVGLAKAAELIWTGEIIDAEEALRLGMIGRVVPHEQLAEETLAFAAQLAAGPALAYARMKENLNRAETADLLTLLEQEALNMRLSATTQDHREAAQSFVEKRTPTFAGE